MILKNIGWLSGDKLVRMGIGLFVGVWVARYLGPTQFGLLNHATAFIAIFGVFATLGIDNILVRDLLKEPTKKNELLGSAFILKLAGGIIGVITLFITIYSLNPKESYFQWIILILSFSFLFQSFDVIEYYFQSKVQSWYVVYARNISFIIVTIVKVMLIFLKCPLTYFVWAILIELIISSVLLIYAFQKGASSILRWKFNASICKRLLTNSFPLILSSFMVMIYMKVDQVMIGNLLGNKEVGIYSSGIKIVEIWNFVPMIIANSIFPSLVNAKAQSQEHYIKRLKQLYSLMIWLSIAIAIIIAIFADIIINMLYGQAFSQASSVLVIYVWAGIATFLGVASSQYLMIENLNMISFYRTLIGMGVNIVLNYFLIPVYGIIGAAIATLISYNIATFGLFFFKSSRKQFYLILKSFNPF